jgi:hypothetical protein
MGIGLCCSRGVRWQRRAQVAELRHGDDTEAATDQQLPEFETLIVAAASTTHDQHRRTVPGDRILDRPARRLDDVAASRDALARMMNIALIPERGQPGEGSTQEAHQKRHGSDTYSCHAVYLD